MAQINWDSIIGEGKTDPIIDNIPDAAALTHTSEPHVACILLVDTSGSMGSQNKIDKLNAALKNFKNTTIADPISAKRVDVSVIEFNTDVNVVVPFTPIMNFNPPTLTAHGATSMATGIRYAIESAHKQVKKYHQIGIQSFKPFILMITDGYSTEDMSGIAELIANREGQGKYGHLRFHAFGVQGADMDTLAKLTNRVLAISNNAFDEIFNWASKSMQAISASTVGAENIYSEMESNMHVYDPKTKKLPWDN